MKTLELAYRIIGLIFVIGLGHSNSFMNDRYRVLGAAAETRINSQF